MNKSTTKPTSRKASKPPLLTDAEVERIAEKLATALEHDAEEIALLLLLVGHLERVREDAVAFGSVVFEIKKKLFIGTCAAEDAQQRFEAEALAKRGTLLAWPSEQAA